MDLSDEDAMSILNVLREQTRNHGMANFDAQLTALFLEDRQSPKSALALYLTHLHDYLAVFSEESISTTERILDENLKREAFSFRVSFAADEESISNAEPLIGDLRSYGHLGQLAEQLMKLIDELHLSNELGRAQRQKRDSDPDLGGPQ